jgi:hypothetical protein
LKASVKQIVDAYTQAVEKCNQKILEVNRIHKDQSEESRAYETRKIINKWFRTGGLI